MKLVVGLGNPGKLYEKTRHNIGFMALDQIAETFHVEFNKSKFNGKYAEINILGEKVILLKPQSYINLSGEVIQRFISFYKLNIEDVFIIHDDLDLEIGKFKIKPEGSSGGHNGLKNIEMHLGTQKYKRMKIGISNNKEIDTKDYVLGKVNLEDFSKLNEILLKMPSIFTDYMCMSFDLLMNKYNKK